MSLEIPNQTKASQWRQILIVLAASLVMALACCGGSIVLDEDRSHPLAVFAGLLLAVGALSLLVFVISLLVAFGKVLSALFSRLRD